MRENIKALMIRLERTNVEVLLATTNITAAMPKPVNTLKSSLSSITYWFLIKCVLSFTSRTINNSFNKIMREKYRVQKKTPEGAFSLFV